jgi:hypothetical protein
MSLRESITQPIYLMMAVLIGVAILIVAIVSLAGTGIGGASVSTQLVSTNTNLTNALPFIGILVAAGLVFVAMGKR